METGVVAAQINEKEQRKRGIPGSTLKLIAMASMLIDHTAACILYRVIMADSANFDARGQAVMTPVVVIYFIMRGIGRLAFPIYIFLLLEGFEHTRSRWWYLGRLVIFALISEIPFDMALSLSYRDARYILDGHILEFSYQNVFWTLAIGMLTIILTDKVGNLKIDSARWGLQLIIAALGMGLAYAMKTDYDAVGVLAIVAAYWLRKNRIVQMLGICISLLLAGWIEAAALVDILPVTYYNGRRGASLKWIFYAFYPVHLLILFLICVCMGF